MLPCLGRHRKDTGHGNEGDITAVTEECIVESEEQGRNYGNVPVLAETVGVVGEPQHNLGQQRVVDAVHTATHRQRRSAA